MNAYKIEGPALISFSGGRTSGFMLHEILAAHGGQLPADVHVAFANTGKERPETLAFVHECASRWGVRVRWLEFRMRSGPWEGRYEEVGFNSASRAGEPFAALIAAKKFTPNSMARFCSEEGHRCLKAYARNAEGKVPWRTVCPMDKARATKREVMAFWGASPFDLGLRPYEGNCDLCFLKARRLLTTIMREQPGAADWWIGQEEVGQGRFVTEYSYAELARDAHEQQVFPFLDEEDFDVECGLVCA